MSTRNASAALVALLLAGCGGGGDSSEEAVSANPPAEPIAEAPGAAPAPAAPAPGLAPTPAQPPAPTPDAPTPPPATSPPAASPPAPPGVPPPASSPPASGTPNDPPVAKTIPGAEVERAIRLGVPLAKPFPPNFAGGPTAVAGYHFANMRRVFASDGTLLALYADSWDGGSNGSGGTPGTHPETGRGMLYRDGRVSTEFSGQSINVREANLVNFSARYIDLSGTLTLDSVAGEWRNGNSFVQLLPQSIPGRDDAFRLCWLFNLPDTPVVSLIDNRGAILVPAGPPVYRLQCSEHRRSDGKDIGGYIVDDVAGAVTTYRGAW